MTRVSGHVGDERGVVGVARRAGGVVVIAAEADDDDGDCDASVSP
jgi:hypothetical protein